MRCHLQQTQREDPVQALLQTTRKVERINDRHGRQEDHDIRGNVPDCVDVPEDGEIDAGAIKITLPRTSNGTALEDCNCDREHVVQGDEEGQQLELATERVDDEDAVVK